MKHPWVLLLAPDDEALLAPLRLAQELEVATSAEALWLRGPALDDTLHSALQALPARARYERLADGRLRPLGSRIASERLPDLPWRPLRECFQVTLPTPALPGEEPPSIALRLVRCAQERTADVLLVPLGAWTEFATTAAEIRLRPLRFAASVDGQALVLGTPLPSLPGQRFVDYGGVALPAGFTWEPAVSLEVLQRCLGVTRGGLILWLEDGNLVRLHSEQFLPATRGAARATQEGFSNPI